MAACQSFSTDNYEKLASKKDGAMKEEFLTAPQPTMKRLADVNGPDFYPTPEWATTALIENEFFDGDIWECACGDGAMSEILKKTGSAVYSSDLFDRGYGETGVDFLNSQRRSNNIVTNPPYNSAEAFVQRASELSDAKFAFLLRLAFLEGANRQKKIFNVLPPSRVWIFSERITFYPRNVEVKGSGTTAYAWFVWDKKQIGETELKWLPLGYKESHKKKVTPSKQLGLLL